MRSLINAAGLAVLLLSGCGKESIPAASDQFLLAVPEGFPEPDIPPDNTLTISRVALGKRLFFDPVLSRDSSISCASCHKPALAFADDMPASPGIEGRPGTRNAPSLANVAYQKRLLREGGVPTLEMQILVPIQEHNEFDFNILEVAERLKKIPAYVALSDSAYGRAPDPFVITRSIAAFERTLLSGDAPFDKWYFQNQFYAVLPAVRRGFNLFNSERLNCGKCHSGFLFTNQEYANNGLYEVYPDSGRIRLTGLEADRALFKVPGLRNIAVTAPYMHDGSLTSLEAVIAHYESGGKAHPNKSPLVKPFTLTAREKADLLTFLESLTDNHFLQNPDFQ